MSVVLSVEETGPCEKKLEVEVPAATVEAETVRIAVEFRKQAKLPGFRKGKVPMEMVRQRFGEDIDQEVLDRLLPRYWRQAEAEVKLEALLPPTVDDVSHEAGKALVFKATVEVRPEFGLDNLEGFDLPSPPTAVTDEEVERMLEDLRRSVAPWVETERSAAHGDLVEATLLEVEADGIDGPQPVTFEVGDPNVWEELTLEVTGKKGGQSGAFSRSHEHEGETHIQEFQIDLTAVKERDLPPLEDELAAKIGKFSTLDKLRADISKRIGSGKALEARRMREQALLDQLRERNPTTLPKRVLDNEIRQMLTDYADGLGARGVDPSQADIDWQQLSDQVRPQAEARVHARLLLDAVAELFALEVSEEVFEATLARLARSQGKSAAQLRRALDSDGRLAELRAQLRREGALKRLLGEDDNGSVESPDMPSVAAVEEE